jgi:hypothetical protein
VWQWKYQLVKCGSDCKTTNLRDPFRTNKAASFDILQSGPCKTVDEFNFDVYGYDTLLILQTITRADFDDVHEAI